MSESRAPLKQSLLIGPRDTAGQVFHIHGSGKESPLECVKSSWAGLMVRNMAGAVFLVLELLFELQIVAGMFCVANILHNFSTRSHFQDITLVTFSCTTLQMQFMVFPIQACRTDMVR